VQAVLGKNYSRLLTIILGNPSHWQVPSRDYEI
jgi:hypothetical protein